MMFLCTSSTLRPLPYNITYVYYFFTDDVHNLPQVTSCTTELNDWVYGTKDLARYTSKELPTLVRRFVEDAYLCIYVDHDGIMYGGDDA